MSVSSVHSSQRSHQSSADDNLPTLPSMASEDPQQRSGAGSGRSSGGRSRQNPQQQLSTIEKSVTHLLVATKQLLETLTLWSRNNATEGEVSDVYVRLGYEFNIACRAFNAIGVETSDLGPVPDLLRGILEDTLSQVASQASLDRYLPRIRDIIINLLHGLKKKQQRLRQKNAGVAGREGGAGGDDEARPPRQASTASNASAATSLSEQLDNVHSRHTSSRSYLQRQGSGDMPQVDLPPRTTSVQSGGRGSPRRQTAQLSPQNSMHQSGSRDTLASDSSSMSSTAMQNIPVIAPYPEAETMPSHEPYEQPGMPSPEPPRPPPKQNDALSALQRGGDLERRASRRFSAYQIQKHLGTAVNGIAPIPPAQRSPIPNRGRDVKESLSAVRSRGSLLQSRARSRNNKDLEPSPNHQHDVRRISEETSSKSGEPSHQPAKALMPIEQLDSPMVKTPDDKIGGYPFPAAEEEQDHIGATVNGPVPSPFAVPATESEQRKDTTAPVPRTDSRRQAQFHGTPPPSQFIPEGSPQAGKELTLFLQYKSKIKKFVLPDGGDLTIPRLQLAFIEKFAWNTHNNGVDLPEIYIQDPVSGVRHELEDLTDIKERSVLVLNVEALDEVKRHIDDGIGGLRRIVEGIKSSVDDQQSALQRVSDRQQETAKELAGIAAAPPARSSTPSSSSVSRTGSISVKDRVSHMNDLRSLRRDLAVVRQTYNSFVSDMQASMSTVKTKAASVKKAAADAAIPDMDSNTGRAYVNKGKKQLSDDSEKIVNRVDDLQDVVEDLRKDVVSRGVRPLPRQLETVSKDISFATSELKKLQEYLRKEKPVWTKIWEQELQVVCDDRDLLTMQEELAADLEDDLEKAAATFALVEQATKQQNLQNPQQSGGQGTRSSSRTLNPLALGQGADPHKAKDNVLGEVRALQPNHESRLEAIERAEKARQRELESRQGGEFQRELGNFVGEGKLKKSGGVEEVERVRKLREEKSRREVFERQQNRLRDQAEKEGARPPLGAAGNTNGVPPEMPNGGDASSREKLEVPLSKYEGERESSPEPVFVEAREEVNA